MENASSSIEKSFDNIATGTGTTTNGVQMSLRIASVFFSYIIGQQGKTVKSIQAETGTTIKIPRKNDEDIQIIGKTEESVALAQQRIESIVLLSRDKIPVNHFSNFRITNDAIRSKYERLMQEILQELKVDGLTEKMFMPPIKLHITINVMTLLDGEECTRASDLLKDCVEKIIIPAKSQYGKITLNVSGVKIFDHANKNRVSVVFGQIQSDTLQNVSNEIMNYFVEKGVSKPESGRTTVNMHMTLINTRYDRSACDGRKYQKQKQIDASLILEKYADYDFGMQEVYEILLSSMKVKDDDGFYKTIASIKF